MISEQDLAEIEEMERGMIELLEEVSQQGGTPLKVISFGDYDLKDEDVVGEFRGCGTDSPEEINWYSFVIGASETKVKFLRAA